MWKGNVGGLAESAATLRTSLDAGELARASAFHHEADRTRFLLSHGLLRALAAHYVDRPAAALAFARGEFGKPELAGLVKGRLAFNLSHSGDLILLAFARSGRLGVDVERWSTRLGDAERARIASSAFSAGEQAAIARLPQEARHAAFYAVWTRKEACLKATGAGLSRGLDHFEVPAHPGSTCLGSDSSLERGDGGWQIFDLPPLPGYSAALATDRAAAHVETLTIDASLLQG